MPVPTLYVGLDLDLKSKQITACIGTRPWKLLAGPTQYSDSLAGFQQLAAWLHHQHCTTKQTVVCMPSSGFLGEPLAYYLALRGYHIAVESPLKIQHAFAAQKPDRCDIGCREIAEYACRHARQLHPWQPSAEKMSQVQALLTDERSQPRPSTMAHRALSRRSHGAGGRLLMERGDRSRVIDAEIRRLLMPPRTIAEEWPCY